MVEICSKKMKCMKCEFYTFDLESFLDHQSGGHEDIVPSNTRESFHIPDFQGFYCLLQGSRSRERYYVTEVTQPASSNHDNLSATCYFFIPSLTLDLNPNLLNQKDVRIPFTRVSRDYRAEFPNSQIMVKWATNREVGERLGLRTSSDRKAVSKLLDDPFNESSLCLFNCLLIKQNNPDWQHSD